MENKELKEKIKESEEKMVLEIFNKGILSIEEFLGDYGLKVISKEDYEMFQKIKNYFTK